MKLLILERLEYQYQARELITIINKEKKDKGYYIPNMYQVPKEWLEQRLGFKIKNA